VDIDNIGMIIIDDTVIKKLYSRENKLIAYHYDNSKKRAVKGINILNFLLTSVKPIFSIFTFINIS